MNDNGSGPSNLAGARMSPPSNPSETARETLRQLAQRRLPPTPDNYRTIFHQIAGSEDSGSAPRTALLRRLLAHLPRSGGERQQLLLEAEQALEAQREEQALERLDHYFELVRHNDALAWNELIGKLLQGWEARHEGWTTARKREALQRVLTATDAGTLYKRLQGLLQGWKQGSADPEDSAAQAQQPAAEHPPTAPPTPAGSGTALPAGLELLPALRQLLSTALREVVPSFIGSHPELEAEVDALADAATALAEPRDIDALAQRIRRLAHQLEMLAADDAEVRAGLLELLRLLLRNIDELVLDDKWFAGQIEMLREIIDTPPNPRTLDDAGRRLKELIYKQSQLKHNLIQSQLQLRSMLAGFVDQLALFSESTGSYHDHIGQCAQRIANATEISEIAPLLDEVMRETRTIQDETQRSRQELDKARAEVGKAEQRIADLQQELDEASRLMRHDQLTGVLNRRGLEEMFTAESARARRRGSSLALALLDIDNFKKLNDNYGHQVGDEALIHLATVVRRHLRPQDVLSRYGGEEFVILLPEAETNEAHTVLTRLQRELTREFFMANQQRLVITFSAGLTLVKADEALDPPLQRADAAMYQAKQAGRNRVMIAAADLSPPA